MTLVIESPTVYNFDLMQFSFNSNHFIYLRICSIRLLKTLCEKEKLPTVFSANLENFLLFSSKLKLSSANSLRL